MSGGIFYSAFFHFGNSRRHRDDDSRGYELAVMDLLDEMAEHGFGDFEVRDHAVFHGPNGHDISRRASEHPFGFIAYGKDVGSARLNRDH